MPRTAPYGTWESPIDAAAAVSGLTGYGEIQADGDDVYWLELRPREQGRQVLVRWGPDRTIEDLTPAPTNVRTRVHEYGGGAYLASDGHVWFSEFSDQRLHRLDGDSAVPITAEPPHPGSVRYADLRLLRPGRLVCVRETHPEEGEPVNELVALELATGKQTVLAAGRDFYASPRVSPDGTRLAWLEWDHPNMPWDGTELVVATVEGPVVDSRQVVAGGPSESIFQPEWSPEGDLVFSSDRSGWWNLYRLEGTSPKPIFPREADFGEPLWIFGRTTFGFLSDGRILAGGWEAGRHVLWVIERDGGARRVEDDHSNHAGLVTDGRSRAYFVGHHPLRPTAIVEMDVDQGTTEVIRSNPLPVPEEYLPHPKMLTFPTGDGETAHAVYYPPENPDFVALDGELPPLIVQVHGGPTSNVFPRLSVGFVYWTSRGFGVVDVNYRGSTGFGRAFRERLNGNWGLADVEDCLAAAQYLATEGEVDGDRLVITGGSAGGFTALAALAFGDAFDAGASYYGVADLELLARHTHKFESRYLDQLVSPDPEVMRQRSPLYAVEGIDVPVILFQGGEDRVVPPEQAKAIADALLGRGVPHALITYPEEDHGFRKAENIVHSLESELAFYGQVFGFTPAGELPEVPLASQ